jgi:soluble lytic murein transglycosylase-like protein
MESRIQAVMARIQEIEARMGQLNPTRNPIPNIENSTPNAQYLSPSAQRPAPNALFNVALAQANGSIGLIPLAGGAWPFAPDVESLIAKHATQNGLAPELVRAVIQQESGGNPRSVSVAGARGLMQLMPDTAAMYGVRDSFDPEQNIAAGTRHLAGLLREFNGDTSLALAAYNAGSGAVRKYNGVPPYAETQQYVRRIQGMLGR